MYRIVLDVTLSLSLSLSSVSFLPPSLPPPSLFLLFYSLTENEIFLNAAGFGDIIDNVQRQLDSKLLPVTAPLHTPSTSLCVCVHQCAVSHDVYTRMNFSAKEVNMGNSIKSVFTI